MEEKIKELLGKIDFERFPILIIIFLVIYIIFDENTNPYRIQHEKIKIISELKSLKPDSTLTKQFNSEYLKIYTSVNEKKEIDYCKTIPFAVGSIIFIFLYTFLGFYHNPNKKYGGYILSLLIMAIPTFVLSFLLDFYLIKNMVITLSLTLILGWIILRLYKK